MNPTYQPVLDDETPAKKQEYWSTAFGLQAVDNLQPSEYVRELATDHIEGKKTYAEVAELTQQYYINDEKARRDTSAREADEVSEAIYSILADESFRFDILTLKSYHRRLFEKLEPAIYHPGEFRTVNLTKKEPVLGGETVQYQDYGLIQESLEYDFGEEAAQNYLAMDFSERLQRITTFTSRIWQVHPFYEGNTRTTAVFIEKYLRSLGYTVDNKVFRDHAREFRDALVLANYSNIPKGIQADPAKLLNFMRQILGE